MKLTTETKIIGAISLATVLILVGGVMLFTRPEPKVPEGQLVARNGLHWHPKLSLVINGQSQEIPDGVGSGAVEMPMHTHKEDHKDGVIHMEMSGTVVKDQTKLGRFFQIWGKVFNLEGEKITMMVNGKENTEFENYPMKDGDVIEIKYQKA